MAKNEGKYTEIDYVPYNAVPVQYYADQMGFSKQYVYKLLRLKREGKRDIDFEMAIWKGVNLVIPNKKK